jgi:hypothetical protein
LRRGDVLAERFTILRFVAAGGMGEVYEAQDQVLQAHVALKTILPELGADPEMLERLRREVLLARKASHPNVCRVYDLYSTRTPDGEPLSFLTMDFLDGETLAHLLARQGRMSIEEALPLVRQVAAGLDAAHAEGVVHRDLKASNVMLVRRAAASAESGDLRAVITDFGIARGLPVESLVSEMPTGSGVIGTPQYMAPEQLSGGRVGPAADVYALGLMIYEMVTGTLPFAGATPLEMACKRLKDPPVQPRSLVPSLDPRWNGAILRSLAPRPEARFASAGELARALEARPGVRVGRRTSWAALGLVGLAVAVVLATNFVRKSGTPGTAPPFRARRAVAVAGIVPDVNLGAQAWIAPTLGALVPLELATAERELRVIAAEEVGRARRSLGLQDQDLPSEKGRKRLSTLLGVPTIVVGSLRRLDSGQLQAVFTVSGASEPISVSFEEQDVLETSRLLGRKLREALGAPDPADDAAFAAVRPRSILAARRFADGVDRWVQSDYPAAVQAFADSAGADQSFYPSHILQAWVRDEIGHRKRARAEAQLALEAAARLPVSARQLAEMTIRQAEGDESGAARIGAQLFDQFPDDTILALVLTTRPASPEVALALLARNRTVLAGTPETLRFQLHQAFLRAIVPGAEVPIELFDRAEREATALGATVELGDILETRALLGHQKGGLDLALLDRAESAYRKGWYLEGLARINVIRARWMTDPANPRRPPLPQSVATYREALANLRRLGLTSQVIEISIDLARATFNVDIEGAEALVKEVDDALKSLDEPPPVSLLSVRCWMAWRRGDLIQARQALSALRAKLGGELYQTKGDYGFLEGLVLIEEDRLEEARAVFERDAQRLRSFGWEDAALKNQNFACLAICDQGRFEAGMACLGEVKSALALSRNPMPAATDTYHRVRTECAVAAKRLQEAKAALDEASGSMMQDVQSAQVAILRAKFDAALGHETAAAHELRELLALMERKRWALQRLEAELALGETELRVKPERGRGRLVALHAEATRMGFVRIARLASEALSEKSVPD